MWQPSQASSEQSLFGLERGQRRRAQPWEASRGLDARGAWGEGPGAHCPLSRGLDVRGALGEGLGVRCPSELDCPPAGVGFPFTGYRATQNVPNSCPRNKGRKKGQPSSPKTDPSHVLSTVCCLRCLVPTSL